MRRKNKLPAEKKDYDKFLILSDDKITKKKYDLMNKGIVLLDKPKGITSHQITYKIRDLLNVKKAGHSGTLDPNVTGLLLITLGKACKLISIFLGMGKEYIGVMHLHAEISEERIYKVFKEFVGEIEQVPPVRSAVKRVKRKRKIYYLDILSISNKDVKFLVGCEAGTYIRKLCVDIGDRLGVGAHMTWLRRTKIGYLSIKNAVSFDKFKKGPGKYIVPVEEITCNLPRVYVKKKYIKKILNGVHIKKDWIIKLSKGINDGEYICVLSPYNETIALAKKSGNFFKISSVLGCENL